MDWIINSYTHKKLHNSTAFLPAVAEAVHSAEEAVAAVVAVG